MTYEPRGDSPEDRAFRQQAAQEAVGALVAAIDPGVLATRFVMIVEVVDTQGGRGMWMLAPPDTMPQDTLGLMDHARSIEQAAIIASALDGFD